MKTLLAAAILALTAAGSASAASDKEACRRLSNVMPPVAKSLRTLSDPMTVTYDGVLFKFEGADKAALEDLEKRRVDMANALEAYASALEDTGYLMARCAR